MSSDLHSTLHTHMARADDVGLDDEVREHLVGAFSLVVCVRFTLRIPRPVFLLHAEVLEERLG
eukprot:CAMPEP_0118942334 /NCGR_PEP_ID=MMETSP1169-20130426/35991_1 /TAXON_ID=36882 /ORGANISM="Pyramimonas obovata, Strain CCMP722" /LENGTH=62 /DNA_ID=CAMNT_0006887341 /DNA_START=130 /DNA_END=315 /DNA_ORIENTATION=-